MVTQRVTLRVDGTQRPVAVDTRTTLLDALRDHLGVFSPKKGCDHGQCGACTVLVNGQRRLSCLTFTVANDDADITTAASLGGADSGNGSAVPGAGQDGPLHPMQQAFIDHDGFQCGYCTPGQVCSAVAMVAEVADGQPSHVTADLTGQVTLDDEEIRERMSGNLCRCGAYVNIVAAIREGAGG